MSLSTRRAYKAGGHDTLQYNKAVNIDIAGKRINGIVIRPGEVFSFWRTVGRTTKAKGYLPGRIIEGGELKPGIGGGLCNLGNTVHLLGLHSPLDVTEVHHHSDALAPDHGKRVPFSSGTSVSYNYLDLRFKNNTDQAFQLMTWCQDEKCMQR
jgi:vancomycin resistance protein VanW